QNEVFSVAFSSCQQSVPAGFEPTVLQSEWKSAQMILGVKEGNQILFDYEVRKFGEARQAILEELIRLKREIRPDVVLLPSRDDVHQDHTVIAQECIRAFKYSSLLQYELPWNNLQFTASLFVSLTAAQVAKKAEAVAAYASQAHRNYCQPEFLRSLATVRGVQSGHGFAEAFDVIRWNL
ncbi:MAG: PIG-L family deacetylase, partial [Chitinophagaceae bacterium]